MIEGYGVIWGLDWGIGCPYLLCKCPSILTRLPSGRDPGGWDWAGVVICNGVRMIGFVDLHGVGDVESGSGCLMNGC
jgi:hypothetical protein